MDSSMNLQPLSIRSILQEHDIRLKKSLGQNFLTDIQILEKIVQAAEITQKDNVLEIGPGVGSLTRHIALQARQVFAVELDERLLPALEEVLAPFDNIRILNNDILKVDLTELLGNDPYVIIANIPYYITSAVLRHCLESNTKPKRMILTIQKEVARRICQGPGDMSLLALSVQLYGKPKILFDIPAGAFFPSPNVDSTVLSIELFENPLIPRKDIETFFRWSKAGFSQKRKKLRNSLSAGLHISTREVEDIFSGAGIDPQRRAETLSIAEWHQLIQQSKKSEPPAMPVA